jgi:selenoprotein W-related protein
MKPDSKPIVAITYCTQCQWLLRAAWMAQELLSTFGADLGGVTLVPGTGGIFQVTVDGTLVWDRKSDGGFPDAKVLKQRVRDRIDPGRDLGHADRQRGEPDGA